MHADWQTWVTLAVGAGALAHVTKRWWPSLSGLFRASPGAPKDEACGQASASVAAAPGCGSGCGQCGAQTPTTVKDHRVHVVKRPVN